MGSGLGGRTDTVEEGRSRRRLLRSVRTGVTVFVSLVAVGAGVDAAPVSVRFPEGTVYGTLTLKSLNGVTLAHGELIQTLRGDLVDSRLTFQFEDGSLYDETVVFTQQKVFRMVSYRLIQRGRSFPEATDLTFQRETGTYQLRFRKNPKDAEQTFAGKLDLPADLYNGMASILIKNLPPGATGTAHLLAFTPEPRLLTMALRPAGQNEFFIGSASRQALRYHVKLELGGVPGLVATVIGKQPPDLYYWIAGGQAPAFLKFEGPFYLRGPIWRIELTAPRWPK
jgi:hypothetical protein